jgi:protein required for attachment to host cells
MNRTWILVADAAKARLFEAPEPGSGWRLLEDLENPEGRARSRDFLADEAGGVQHDEGAVFRNAMEPLSIKKVEAKRFAKDLAHTLNQGVNTNRYDRLVIVAPPEFLGMLRHELTTQVMAKVVDTVPKDYTQSNVDELTDRLMIVDLV